MKFSKSSKSSKSSTDEQPLPSSPEEIIARKTNIRQFELIRQSIGELRREIKVLKNVSPIEANPIGGKVAELLEALKRYESALYNLEKREESLISPYRKKFPAFWHKIFVMPLQLMEIKDQARKLKGEIDTTISDSRDTTNSRRPFTIMNRFARSGCFPPPNELGKDDDFLDAHEKEYFTPAYLREEYQNYRLKNGLPLVSCKDLACTKHCDAITGDTSYRRQIDLQEISLAIVTVLVGKMYQEQFLSVETKNSYRTQFLHLCNQSFATVLYFHYAQFESRELVDQLFGVTQKMTTLVFSNRGGGSKVESDNYLLEIDSAFDGLKMGMESVIVHHDQELMRLRRTREMVVQDCNTSACFDTLEVLLSGKAPVESIFTDVEYGWVCRKCSVFEYVGVAELIEQRTRLPCFRLADHPNVTPTKYTGDPELGSVGGFADIYRIEEHLLDGPELGRFKHRFNTGVAIKRAKVVSPKEEDDVISRRCQRIVREFAIWSQLSHENVVPLLGICVGLEDAPFPCPIMPWLEGGDLYAKLHETPPTNETIIERLSYMRDVASALDYMHNHPLCIVHGDLKTNNILLHNGRAYLTDFGISYMTKCKGLSTKVHGNYNFVAPELLFIATNVYLTPEDKSLLDDHPAKPTKFTDMYAYGMVLYQVLTCSIPYSYDTDVLMDMRITDRFRIPPRHSMITNNQHWNFMCHLWDDCPYLRPSASDAQAQMEKSIQDCTTT